MLNNLRQNRFVALFLATTILFLSIQPVVNAAIVSTSDLVAEQQSVVDREYLLKSFNREDVKAALVSQGVDLENAKLRVASMTDEEIRILNTKMDELPAGGIVGTIALVLVILLITDLAGVTDVYPFIKK